MSSANGAGLACALLLVAGGPLVYAQTVHAPGGGRPGAPAGTASGGAGGAHSVAPSSATAPATSGGVTAQPANSAPPPPSAASSAAGGGPTGAPSGSASGKGSKPARTPAPASSAFECVPLNNGCYAGEAYVGYLQRQVDFARDARKAAKSKLDALTSAQQALSGSVTADTIEAARTEWATWNNKTDCLERELQSASVWNQAAESYLGTFEAGFTAAGGIGGANYEGAAGYFGLRTGNYLEFEGGLGGASIREFRSPGATGVFNGEFRAYFGGVGASFFLGGAPAYVFGVKSGPSDHFALAFQLGARFRTTGLLPLLDAKVFVEPWFDLNAAEPPSMLFGIEIGLGGWYYDKPPRRTQWQLKP